MSRGYQITEWCHRFIRERVREGGFCIDATAGKGADTVLLAELVGAEGRVLAFDIQEEAVLLTRKRVEQCGAAGWVRVVQESHVDMGEYAMKGTVDGIVFNFGYLPGGDHAVSTKAETSVEAVKSGLELLKPGGFMSLCIYSGGDTGFEEMDALLTLLKDLDEKRYMVIVSRYYNRPNNPPIPAFIIKL